MLKTAVYPVHMKILNNLKLILNKLACHVNASKTLKKKLQTNLAKPSLN